MFVFSGCTTQIEENDFKINQSDDIVYMDVSNTLNLLTNVDGNTIYWQSLDTNIITINNYNKATAINSGVTCLVAKNSETNELVKKIAIVVEEKAPFISIIGSANIYTGKTSSFQITCSNGKIDSSVVWSTLDKNIATVDENGVVTGVNFGVTKLKAVLEANEEIYAEMDLLVQKSSTIDKITNTETSSSETVDLSSLETIFKPVIEKGLSSVIGISTYVNTIMGTNILYSIGSGVIYKRNIVLKSGEEVAYSKDISTDDIENYKYYVITNKHVIESGSTYKIYYGTDNEIDAKLIQYDTKIDLAVLYFTSKIYFGVATFANSDETKQGEFCIALGNPFGYEYYKSANLGIVSHPTRYVSDDTDGDSISDWDAKYIQHDAPINEGNSGGPLINLKGEVIGINTLKLTSEEIDNMGFAIPSNLVLELIELLEQGIQPVRPLLGVTVTSVKDIRNSASLQAQYTVPDGITYGMYITEVIAGGLGYKAGIKTGDILLEFNNIQIHQSYQLRAELGKLIIGSDQKVEIKVYRDGKVVALTVTA